LLFFLNLFLPVCSTFAAYDLPLRWGIYSFLFPIDR
jgi:hypothetical protein